MNTKCYLIEGGVWNKELVIKNLQMDELIKRKKNIFINKNRHKNIKKL